MKKLTILLVIIFTFLFSNTSWGEWSYITEGVNGDKFYYDKDRLRKSKKLLYFWILGDFIKRVEMGNLSVKLYVVLDCSILRWKGLRAQGYKNSMGEGKIVGDITPEKEKWRYPPPNSSYDILFNKICEEHQ